MIIKAIEFPGREFSSKDELFKALKENKERIIGLKKAQIYKAVDKGQYSFLNAEKLTASEKGILGAKDGFIYPVISTTRYFDSHKDVHFDGSMTKTATEQQGKVHYALDHELKFNSIVAWPNDVRMFVQKIDWSVVGKNYPGQTEALIFEIAKENIAKPEVLKAIENRSADFENSIRMAYIKINLGVDSNDEDYKEEKAYFDSRINLIANKEDVDTHFWGVEELAIHKEGSLVVAGGSNDATTIFQKDMSRASTPDTEPEKSTQSKLKFL